MSFHQEVEVAFSYLCHFKITKYEVLKHLFSYFATLRIVLKEENIEKQIKVLKPRLGKVYSCAAKNFTLYFSRLGHHVGTNNLVFKGIGVFHNDLYGEIPSLSALFIDHCKSARDSAFYNNFSEWDSHTADVITHATHSHINRLIDQIDRQNLALHVLQKLG